MCEANKNLTVQDYNLNGLMCELEFTLHTAWLRYASGSILLYGLHSHDIEEKLVHYDELAGDEYNWIQYIADLPVFFGSTGKDFDEALCKLRAKLKHYDDCNIPWADFVSVIEYFGDLFKKDSESLCGSWRLGELWKELKDLTLLEQIQKIKEKANGT